MAEGRINGRARLALLAWSLVLCTGNLGWADYPNAVLDDLPYGYWRLNDPSGTGVAVNIGSSGPALNGTYFNVEPGAPGPSELPDGTPVLGMGARNTALDVGSQDSYIAVDESLLSNLSEFSLSGWFSPRDLAFGTMGLIGQRDAIGFGFTASDTLSVQTALGGSLEWQFSPGGPIQELEWFHAAVVGTGERLELYINGDLVQTGGTAIDSSYGVSSFPLRIAGGGVFDASGNQFPGPIDEIAIWDRALTGEQIRVHFDSALAANKRGDFNGDDRFTVEDVNLLSAAIFEGSDDSVFDVSGDDRIDEDDLAFWIGDIALTWFGDANFDGEFNTSDFVLVFQTGEYEDGVPENSLWQDGDWNADLEFDSGDFVTAFQDGGFELGPVTAQAVPEPSCLGLAIIATTSLLYRRRRPNA